MESNTIKHHPIPYNTLQCHLIPSNAIWYHPIPSASTKISISCFWGEIGRSRKLTKNSWDGSQSLSTARVFHSYGFHGREVFEIEERISLKFEVQTATNWKCKSNANLRSKVKRPWVARKNGNPRTMFAMEVAKRPRVVQKENIWNYWDESDTHYLLRVVS